MNKVPWEQKEREEVIQLPGEGMFLRGSHKKVKIEKSYPDQKRRERHSRAKSLNKEGQVWTSFIILENIHEGRKKGH